MSTTTARDDTNGFVRFFRNYTKTWIHAVATAGLTAFGTLTIVHRWFAALALASYAVPPVVLYLRRGRARPRDETPSSSGSEPSSEDGRERKSGAERAGSEAEADSVTTPGASESPTASTASPSATTAETPGSESQKTTAERSIERQTGAKTLENAGSAAGDERGEPREETATASTDAGISWHSVDASADATLRDVTVPATGGVYAVGDGGTVLAGDGADEWSVVLEDGPAARGNDLRGADATVDGDAVWVAGDSGSLGRIDVETGRHTDYTAPEDVTNNWLGVAVGGGSDAETVLLITGSGAILRGRYRDGALEWVGPDKPGGGSSLSGVALADDGVGYCCDTNDGIFETTDGGESFERIGLESADGTLTDIATTGREDCLVSADDGVVHRHDGATWTPERVADGSLNGIARRGERTVVCTGDGTVCERATPTADWEQFDADASGALLAVSTGPDRSVAVGERGAIVERR
ncbi:WD40/YVTN/BNR-like repeat-containing protein [Natronorubrum halophilum]|uniref:WD40/YVTN/BNR-like repeat-containing protein n=1 Tax=Natronorubrum halophilum TaxID=1702106 RepID=UPI000EF687A1|nr:hypothetical protein [Natronorubrum halophilum]